jgi:hypothetical protein
LHQQPPSRAPQPKTVPQASHSDGSGMCGIIATGGFARPLLGKRTVMQDEPTHAEDTDEPQEETAAPEDFEDDPARNPDDDRLKDVKGG